jgi:hypothetical protein
MDTEAHMSKEKCIIFQTKLSAMSNIIQKGD